VLELVELEAPGLTLLDGAGLTELEAFGSNVPLLDVVIVPVPALVLLVWLFEVSDDDALVLAVVAGTSGD
jgi:hypothetical protein